MWHVSLHCRVVLLLIFVKKIALAYMSSQMKEHPHFSSFTFALVRQGMVGRSVSEKGEKSQASQPQIPGGGSTS